MKISISINHPAHVHYFKNFIYEMKSKGNEIIVINRDDTLINYLLDTYDIEHITINKRPVNKQRISSIIYLAKSILNTLYLGIKFKPEIFIGFASVPASFTSFILRKPSILLDDTEHNHINHKLYLKFCSVVLTPFYFKKNLGGKQIYFNGFLEQLYLHKKNFSISEEHKIKEEEFALIRFISYNAHHDIGVKEPFSLEEKKKLILELEKKIKVYVSLESNEYDDFFSKYKLDFNPEQIHTVLNNCSLLISEGATMACEAAILGTRVVYINPLKVGYLTYLSENYAHVDIMTGEALLNNIDHVFELLEKDENKQDIRLKIEENTVNPTKLLIWFVENYPQSSKVLQENPEYQSRFKQAY